MYKERKVVMLRAYYCPRKSSAVGRTAEGSIFTRAIITFYAQITYILFPTATAEEGKA